MGKTWFSTHWAHQHGSAFADGQLFVDLRGFDPSGEPATATDALRSFLELLSVPRDDIPESEPGRAAMYRSLTADKQLLVVLDNAADTAQVAPLIPGGSAFVIVTSRRRLTGLAARHCARLIELDILDTSEAREVLTRDIGTDRLASAPESAAELQKWCAGLPLALATMAARIAVHANFPLATFADELRDHASRLDAFDAGESDTNLRSILSWSYHALSGRAARLLGLLGIAYGPDIGLTAVANLAGMPVERTRALLAELEVVHLIQQHRPCRYRMHDLVRLYASDQAMRDQPAASREAALRRLTEYYLEAASTASRLLQMH
jgi:NB-ARC domain